MRNSYGIVYKGIMQNSEISVHAKCVYTLFAVYAGSKNECWPSLTTISKNLGISRPTVVKSISELENNKIIKIIRKKNGNLYILSSKGDLPLNTESSKGGLPSSKGDLPLSSKGGLPKEEHKKNNIKNNTLMSELENSDDKYQMISYKFWKLFKENLKKYKINSTDLKKSKAETWVTQVRLMIETDKRTQDEINEIYNFLKVSKFWAGNIRSTEKLRKQFETLLMKSRSQKKESPEFAVPHTAKEHEDAKGF